MLDEPSIPPESTPDTAGRDLAWMEKVKAGDVEAFRELIEAHQQRIIGVITRMLGTESEAEDLAQQVFIRVWKSASRYEPSAKFTTWLLTITRNLVFNELRRRKRRPVQPLAPEENDDDRPAPQYADKAATAPDAQMLNDEMHAAIQRAIDELPEAQRMAVVLRRYDEVSYEEIAQVLSLSVPAVKSLLFRARTELREKLKRYLDGKV